MNNRLTKLFIVAMICAVSFNSCIGSFSLFNKFAHWNANATDSKYLNAVIGLLLCWVYPICGTVDFLVLTPSNSGRARTHWQMLVRCRT